ncbi:uncharacterized protein LOC107844544 [Capsicum annuum]|uniref:uncharacterized protein LOC107844544 n=1 Tax=Capsicum annuum TaxID=4072 RepID=UPI001FB121BE|nr:uncharacterized protein LOC107844544 [Capsicum annuum]
MIKAVDSQGTISAGADSEANYRKAGTLPSDTVQNPQIDGSCIEITTRSGKMLFGLSMGKAVEKDVSVDKLEESNPVESEKLDDFVDMLEKEDDNKEEVELLTKKQKVSFEPVDNIHHCGVVSSQSLVQKKPDPGAFTIPCTVRSIKFTKALCDLGASINMMTHDIYKKLGLGEPTPTMMCLVMEDRSVKQPVGILYDVPIKVDDFILPVDFMILDCDVDFEVPIILGIPLLATGRVLVNMELNELKFRYGKKEAKFKMQPPMKQLKEMNIFSVMDVF